MTQPQTAVLHSEATFGTADGLNLFRQRWGPEAAARAVLINVHGIGDHSGLYPMLPEHFVPRGWVVHAFDLRGNGRSPGKRGHIDRWSRLRDDLDRFLNVVRAEERGRPLFLLGNSLGGLVVLDYALHHAKGLNGVIAVAAPLGRIGTPAWLLTLGRFMSHVWPGFTLETGLDLSGLSRDPKVCETIVSDPLFHRKGSARLAAEVLDTARDLRLNAAEIVVTGPDHARFAAAALQLPYLNRIMLRAPSAAALPTGHPAQAKIAAGVESAAFICVGETCSLPVTEPGQIADVVNAMRPRSS